MRTRLSFLVGAAVGYVLGSRAGRERYEQIKRGAARARRHPAVNQISEQATALVDVARNTVARTLEEGSKGIRNAARRSDAS